jgi:hypothetical protein
MPLDNTNPRLDWALHLADRGFRIFPLQPRSKTPFPGSWKETATTDPATIRTWFENNPAINYAVNPDDRHVVIDLDRKPDEPDGLTNFAALALKVDDWDWANPEAVETFTVRTPSGDGGLHLYLKTDSAVGNSDALWPEAINVRGVGGYVVGPGCYVDEGEGKRGDYEVVRDADPAPAPVWAEERFRRGGERSELADEPLFDQDSPAAVDRARDFLARRKPAIEGQGGDQHTLITAMHLRDVGLSAEKAVEVMCERGGWNDRCEPPWEIGELSVKVENAYRYARNQPGQKQVEPDSFGDLEGIQDIAELKERFEQERGAPAETPSGLAGIAYRGASLSRRKDRREMIVPEWLMAHGLTAVNAKRGMGKSLMMLDLACNVALKVEDDGRTWMGQPLADDWKVVYICGEDDVGFADNLRAWMIEHGEEPPEDRFLVMAGTVDLMSADSVETWTRYLYDTFSHTRTVVFVDTWQRASNRGGQNKDEDMQMAVHHVEAMAKSLGGPVVAAFHPPKDGSKTLLGSSVLENATTGIWDIEDSNGARKVSVSRIKGKGIGNYVLFDIGEVELGELDDFGLPRSGAIAKRLGGTDGKDVAETAADLDRINGHSKRAAWGRAIKEAFPGDLTANVKLGPVPLSDIEKALAKAAAPVTWSEVRHGGREVYETDETFVPGSKGYMKPRSRSERLRKLFQDEHGKIVYPLPFERRGYPYRLHLKPPKSKNQPYQVAVSRVEDDGDDDVIPT